MFSFNWETVYQAYVENTFVLVQTNAQFIGKNIRDNRK